MSIYGRINMAKNIISLYQELYIRLISLQNQKKSLFQKLEKLQSDAKKSANELSASIEQKKEQLYNTIRKIEIYISKATQYISPINYTPTAENISPSTLQQLFTMSSDTPNGKEHALILFKKASNCKKFYLDEITHLESEIQQKINNVTNSPAAAIIQYQLTEIDNTINNLAKSSQFSNLVLEIKRRSKDCTFDKIKGNDLPCR